MLIFVEGGKPENPEKNPRSKDDNQQQTQPTYDTGSRILTRATSVGGERDHHCATPALLVNDFAGWLLNIRCLFTAPAKPEKPTVMVTGEPSVFNVMYNFGIGGGWTHEFKVLYRKEGERNWKL